ncbi:mannitol dehydrogenase family protein [uncultured Hoeflea sp.]|uniref:mannitol dehydrogenase family protein n=1 Tax=uncultured Hoeflea sp. TaxID=538666 RepID=UPI0030EF4707
MKLSNANLDQLPPGIDMPGYDRAALTPGIVHIGVGNFHRAHQAVYLHRLFETGRDHDWAIIGAGVKSYDEAMRQRLQPQDWLTTIVELDPAGFSAMICGSMIDFCAIDAGQLIETMARPEIRIVSLTVTEGGYYVDAKTGGFDASHPDIIADAGNPDRPATVFGIIIAALMARRAAGIAPFTVMSCDNLPENGHVARNAVVGLAKQRSDDLAQWIEANVAFPCGMVDCITPATGPREISIVAEKFGIEDAAPVVCEPFRQWVLEDNFPMGRPALETVGVQFVPDVAPYELMKLRILNGGHATIAYPAGLLGINYVHDAMTNPLVTGFLDKLQHEEIMPTVPSIEGVSTESYYRKCVERFSNPAIGDTIPRLCFDGSNRQPKFILPTIEARLAAGQPVDGLALESALWCRYCYGTTDSGEMIPPNDPNWDRLTAQAKLARDTPQKWLEMADIYGDLGSNPVFAQAFAAALTALWQNGAEATLTAYINGD